LFRVFRYPAAAPDDDGWGVGEHTDYGLLTLLAQDSAGGLQVSTPAGWMDAPPVEGTFVANIGDMLDRLTGGWYRSTPHRVRNTSGRGRLSFPFFLDPGFTAEIPPLPGRAAITSAGQLRWDGQNVHAFTGTYGDYLLSKVSKVFPQLRRDVLLSSPALSDPASRQSLARLIGRRRPGFGRLGRLHVAQPVLALRPHRLGKLHVGKGRRPLGVAVADAEIAVMQFDLDQPPDQQQAGREGRRVQ
jgi:hypothetical protein